MGGEHQECPFYRLGDGVIEQLRDLPSVLQLVRDGARTFTWSDPKAHFSLLYHRGDHVHDVQFQFSNGPFEAKMQCDFRDGTGSPQELRVL